MSYRFVVITKVPEGEEIDGNLATTLDIYRVVEGHRLEGDFREVVVRVPAMEAVSLRTPVFAVGELLILNPETGREVGYPGRKPAKWDVELEEFDDLDVAVARSWEIVESNLRREAAGDDGPGPHEYHEGGQWHE